MALTITQLAEKIDAKLIGDGSAQIAAVGPIVDSSESDVTFVTNDKHLLALSKTKAGAVIVDRKIESFTKPQLIVKDVNAALIKTLKLFAPKLKLPASGIDPTAKIGKDVTIAESASIGPMVVIGNRVTIGENSVITSGCKIGENSQIGTHSRLDSNVVVYHNCKIGNNVIIQANSTIGATGFGYNFIDGSHQLVPHNGGVIIEDFVEIGTNSCVDRAKFGNTIIGMGTKIDNLVQIAHNVVIGKCCLIVGQVGISGSCKLGDGVVLAGHVGLVDNLELGNGVIVGARSGVTKDVPAGGKVWGAPAIDFKQEVKLVALRARLPEMTEKLKQLTKRVKDLEAAKDDKN